MRKSAKQLKTALATPTPGRYLTVGAAARYLSVSEATVYRMIEAGKIRACRPLKRAVRIDREELDKLMAGKGAAA